MGRRLSCRGTDRAWWASFADFVDGQVRTEVRVPLVYATATSVPVCCLGRSDVSAGFYGWWLTRLAPAVSRRT